LDEAITSFEKAISLKSDDSVFYGCMGLAFANHGRMDEAVASFRKALEIDPDQAGHYLSLTTISSFKIDDALLKEMEAVHKKDILDVRSRTQLCFALFRAYDRMKRYEPAFKILCEGNALKKEQISYDIVNDRELFQIRRDSVDDLRSNHISIEPHGYNIPIFIVGMPRSGTTLVEQILSSHSLVFGAGELPYLQKFAGGNKNFLRNELRWFRDEYFELNARRAGDKQFVIDKMPHNFQLIPIINTAFPESKILHIHRDPAATCWSNFSSPFQDGLVYSFCIKDVVEYFGMYLDLMHHWDNLYGDEILHVDYDLIAEDQENQTRRMLDFIGLDWQEACMHPHQNERVVQTVSKDQVRRPVYKGSSQKWRVYEPFLDGAFDDLEGFVPRG
jgi:tetratricopeptide (TPR) repeat protein